jgi:hypothetical protein
MTASNPSRLGQANLAGASDALFLKVFSGEVMASFNAKTVMSDKTRVRSITSGKSASFAAIGRIGAQYHTPGSEILGSNVEHGEKVVTIDDLLISDSFIANIDEAKNHYEVRSEYSNQMGAALAQTYDRSLISLAVKTAAAATAGAVTTQGSASNTNLGSVTPTIQTIVDALYAEAAAMDELFLPAEDRFVIVSPSTYWGLVQNDKLIDRDFGQNGDYANGTIMKVAGMSIVKSANLGINHALTANKEDYPDFNTKYMTDTSKISALVMQRTALGTVKLMELASESEYDIRRQGTLKVSKMACGHGAVRPEGIRTLTAAV